MSNLVKHAEREMRLAGLYDKDADYGGMIPDAVIKMVKCLADEGHSGGSHAITMMIFNKVANFKTLSPVTNDPAEWMDISDFGVPKGSKGMWQNRRMGSCFSTDGGKTYYDIDAKDDRKINTAVEPKK